MTTDTFWIFAFCLPVVAVLTESLKFESKTYVTDALSQNAFVFKKWTYRGFSFFVTVTKGNITLLSAVFDVSSKDSENRLLIQYNNITKDVSLVLNNVTRGDEGLYQISTSINETAAEGSEIMDNKLNVQLHVVETSEIKQGYAEENILVTEFVLESIFFPRLYHNDQLIAVLRDSACDVSTNSPFYGRIRCSKDTDNNTTRIEINNVSENDTGLYAVITEGSLTKRCFLNITDRFDGINSDQPRNITLSTTARNVTLSTTGLSGTVVNLASTEREPFYIILITTVAVVAIILFFGSLIWIQRRNIKSFKAVKRFVLDTMETTSSAAFSTLGRSPHTTSKEEICTSNSKYLRNTFTNPVGRLQNPTPNVSTTGHITCHNTTQELDDDYYRLDVTDTILNICKSGSRSNTTLLAECHECPGSLIDACPFPSDAISPTESAVHLDRRICNANGQWQVTPKTDTTYAEVKKLSSINNVKAGASCTDGYEMVDVSHFDNRTNGVQDVELALVSGTPNPTFVGISTSMVHLDPGTKDEETKAIFANCMNHASAENLMSYDEEKALRGRKEEQGDQNTIHVIVCNHNAINQM